MTITTFLPTLAPAKASSMQAIARLFEGEGGVEFGFRTGFEAEVIAGSFAQVFFDDRALLVYLHGVNTHVRALVLKLAD
jgi:hypothetical protein